MGNDNISINKSFAMELLHDIKSRNKRLFIIIVMLIMTNAFTMGMSIYYFTKYKTSQTVETVNSYDGSSACINGECNNNHKK